MQEAIRNLNAKEGSCCAICRRNGGEIHHLVERSRVPKGDAREALESRPELLCRLCHLDHGRVHQDRSLRRQLFAQKLGIYGREKMDEALAAVNEHLKLKLTWRELGFW